MWQLFATFSWPAESLLLPSPSIPLYDEKSFLEKRHENLPLLCSVAQDVTLCVPAVDFFRLLFQAVPRL